MIIQANATGSQAGLLGLHTAWGFGFRVWGFEGLPLGTNEALNPFYNRICWLPVIWGSRFWVYCLGFGAEGLMVWGFGFKAQDQKPETFVQHTPAPNPNRPKTEVDNSTPRTSV